MLICNKNRLILRLIYCLLFISFCHLSSVFAQCQLGSLAHIAGEKLTYEVAYNWGLIWVNAGKVEFKVDTIMEEDKKAFYFDSYGESYRFYDWIYKVRDHYQGAATASGLEPIWFLRNTSEGGYMVNNRYDYNWEKGQVISRLENSKTALTIDTMDISPCTFDVLSAIYYARTFAFEDLEIGEKIPIHFIIDGEFFELYLRYMGREEKENRDGKSYDCIKFSVMLVEGTIFKGGEDMMVWVTADENKIPIMVEAKILVGSIKVYLLDYENTLGEVKVME